MPVATVIVERIPLLSFVHTLAREGQIAVLDGGAGAPLPLQSSSHCTDFKFRSPCLFVVLQRRNVVVLCNLKPRNMRGVKSNGMVSSRAGY